MREGKEEILTILNVHGTNVEGSSRGVATLTKEDILAAMKGCNPAGIATLLAGVCNDRSVQDPDFYRIYSKDVIELANREGWRFKEKPKVLERLRSMMQMAVMEVVTQPLCRTCEGHGYVDIVKPCPTCRTVGKKRYMAIEYAGAMGLHHKTWIENWEPKYVKVVNIVKDKEYRVLRKLFQRLSR